MLVVEVILSLLMNRVLLFPVKWKLLALKLRERPSLMQKPYLVKNQSKIVMVVSLIILGS